MLQTLFTKLTFKLALKSKSSSSPGEPYSVIEAKYNLILYQNPEDIQRANWSKFCFISYESKRCYLRVKYPRGRLQIILKPYDQTLKNKYTYSIHYEHSKVHSWVQLSFYGQKTGQESRNIDFSINHRICYWIKGKYFPREANKWVKKLL